MKNENIMILDHSKYYKFSGYVFGEIDICIFIVYFGLDDIHINEIIR